MEKGRPERRPWRRGEFCVEICGEKMPPPAVFARLFAIPSMKFTVVVGNFATSDGEVVLEKRKVAGSATAAPSIKAGLAIGEEWAGKAGGEQVLRMVVRVDQKFILLS